EKKQLDVILDCVKHAKELVSQILTFSMQKEHEYKLLSAEEVVKESMSLIRSFLSATIKINTQIENKCGYILADPVQIHQVIINLVTNANYAMEKKGGTIDISISKVKSIEKVFLNKPVKKGSYICLSIKDTGTGIDSKNLDKIFEPYYSTKKAGKGSGVGLSVVHGIVESHNGYIKVESDKEKGTRFDIYFPKCRRYTDIEIETADDMPIQKGTERVLLVDDDKKVAVMETHMLEKLGYTVTCFTNSLKAIDSFENNPEIFDAVVTDLSMPDLSGIQLAGKIFDIKSDLPIILCTGLGDIIEKKNFESLSIKGFLKKPVAIKELSHTLRKVLDE
ncbi:MAG: response regulator, partial [Desulfobacteraceae bacterium]|nr:response regulator [Desulfobacteraceae bacterium]